MDVEILMALNFGIMGLAESQNAMQNENATPSQRAVDFVTAGFYPVVSRHG